MNIPAEVLTIMEILEKNGYSAYIVGGCVRDMLLGLKPKDYDICTSAYPEQVMELFPKCIPTGIKHGTVTVIINSTPFEVTTFRVETGYTDHRHPDKVVFSDSLTEDLKRRDFTINAMAYHPVKGIIDPFNGTQDLRNRVIRTVGNPRERFDEDALRMLRAIRFQAIYGFSIDKDTFSAIKELSENISLISHERILEELNRILAGSYTEAFRNLIESNLLKHILPVPFSGTADLSCLNKLPEELPARWAGLLWLAEIRDLNDIKKTCAVLKMSNRLKNEIIKTSVLLNSRLPKSPFLIRAAVSEAGHETFVRALKIMEVFNLNGSRLPEAKKTAAQIISEKQCLNLSDLAVSGSDLLSAGMKPGKELGKILNALFVCVLQKPELNRKDILLLFAETIGKKFSGK